MISFGNMMCYAQCLRAIHQTQLNPTISYLHSPGERRFSLSLDISEIFKPIVVDRVIFNVLNKRQIQEKHFDRSLNRCVLNRSGREIFVKALEELSGDDPASEIGPEGELSLPDPAGVLQTDEAFAGDRGIQAV